VKKRVALTIAAVAVAWPLWWLGGAAEGWTGLDDLDAIGPVVAVFLGLSLLARALDRLGERP
jgi:hypothetical protein